MLLFGFSTILHFRFCSNEQHFFLVEYKTPAISKRKCGLLFWQLVWHFWLDTSSGKFFFYTFSLYNPSSFRLRLGAPWGRVPGAQGGAAAPVEKSEKTADEKKQDEAVIYELTAEDVPNIIKKERHVVIMVYSPACGFCRKMEPEFAEAAQKMQGHCAWARLNAQEFGEAARALGVDAYPTTLLFKDGALVKPLPGAMDAQSLIVQVQ